jgi:hypothetical protein
MNNNKIEISKNDLICSICKEPYAEPIFIPSCGHHACRNCLIQQINSNIDNNRKCSVCLVPFNEFMNIDYLNQVKCNYMLSNLVFENFSVKCENNGCNEKILESQQSDHNDICPYFLINCKNKNNGCFEKFMRKNEFEHLKICKFNVCVGKRYGCNYRNNIRELETHQKDCIYKRIGKNIENKMIENMTCYVEEKISDVIEENEKKEKDLLLRIKSLEKTVSSFIKNNLNNHYDYHSRNRTPYRYYNEQPTNNNQNYSSFENETVIDEPIRPVDRNLHNNTSNRLNFSITPFDNYNNSINTINRNLTNTITQILDNDLNNILRNNRINNTSNNNRDYNTFNNDSPDEGEAM